MATNARDMAIGLARVNPNAFIEFMAGYTQGRLHIEMQTAMSQHASCYFEFPRNHGKTDQCMYRCAWEIGHNPDILIKVVQANDDEASNLVGGIKAVLESDAYAEVFPDIKKNPTKWGEQSFRVIRDLISKDPTVAAKGVFGNPGGRADILLFDDVCTLKNAVQNPAQREQVKEACNNTWINMLKPGGRIWRVCTPWHHDDVTAEWRSNPHIFKMRRPCIGTRLSPWPEYWPAERLIDMYEQIGPIAYSRAYELKTMSGDELIFSEEILRKASVPILQVPKEGEIVAAIDMAFSDKNQPQKTKKSRPDYSVVMIARHTPNGHSYPFVCWRDQVSYPAFKKKFKSLCKLHKVDRWIGEANGPQKGLFQDLSLEISLPAKSLSRNRDKYSRATAQQPKAFAGRFHLPRINDAENLLPEFEPVLEEMTSFPVGSNDDTVDCAVDLMGELPAQAQTPGSDNPYAMDIYSSEAILAAAGRYEEYLRDRDIEDGRDPVFDHIVEKL